MTGPSRLLSSLSLVTLVCGTGFCGRAIMEGLEATNNTIFVDTVNARVMLRNFVASGSRASTYGIFGSSCAGVDDSSSLSAVDTQGTGYIAISSSQCVIGTNVSLTNPLLFFDGANIQVNGGKTLTLAVPPIAPDVQVFSGTGSVVITLANSPIRAEWWGAKGDGSSDSSLAFQSADSAATNGGTIYALGGLYRMDNTVTLSHANLVGAGKWNTIFEPGPSMVYSSSPMFSWNHNYGHYEGFQVNSEVNTSSFTVFMSSRSAAGGERVNDIQLINVGVGFRLINNNSGHYDNIFIHGCSTGVWTGGVSGLFPGDQYFNNIIVIPYNTAPIGNAFVMDMNSNAFYISNLTTLTGDYGVWIRGSGTYGVGDVPPENMLFHRPIINAHNVCGVRIDREFNTWFDDLPVIDGNFGPGFCVNPSTPAYVDALELNNASVKGNVGDGVDFAGCDLTINGGSYFGNASSSAGVHVEANACGLIKLQNLMAGTTHWGNFDNAQSYGIRIDSGAMSTKTNPDTGQVYVGRLIMQDIEAAGNSVAPYLDNSVLPDADKMILGIHTGLPVSFSFTNSNTSAVFPNVFVNNELVVGAINGLGVGSEHTRIRSGTDQNLILGGALTLANGGTITSVKDDGTTLGGLQLRGNPVYFLGSDGNIGINTTNPSTLMHLSSGVFTIAGAGSGLHVSSITFNDGTILTSSAGVVTSPGGSNTQVQYNSNGFFAGTSNLTVGASSMTATIMGMGQSVVISSFDRVEEVVRGTVTCQSSGTVPTAISGLVAWYKADSLSLGNAVSIDTWTDSSGNGNDANNSDTGGRLKPTFYTNVINGLPVVASTQSGTGGFSGGSGLEAISVGSIDIASSTVILVLNTDPGGILQVAVAAGKDVVFSNPIDANHRSFGVTRAGGGAGTDPTFSSPVLSGAYNILTYSAGLVTNQGNFWINGVADSSNPATVTPGSASGLYFLGGRAPYNFSNTFVGRYAEVIVYNKFLTNAQRIGVETYLSTKYALAISSSNNSCASQIPQLNHLTEWQDNNGTPLTYIDSAGNVTISTFTVDRPLHTSAGGRVYSGLIQPADTSTGPFHLVADTATVLSTPVSLSTGVTGTLADGSLSSNVDLLASTQTFTAGKTFTSSITVTGAGGIKNTFGITSATGVFTSSVTAPFFGQSNTVGIFGNFVGSTTVTAGSSVTVNLNGAYTHFVIKVGIRNVSGGSASVYFRNNFDSGVQYGYGNTGISAGTSTNSFCAHTGADAVALSNVGSVANTDDVASTLFLSATLYEDLVSGYALIHGQSSYLSKTGNDESGTQINAGYANGTPTSVQVWVGNATSCTSETDSATGTTGTLSIYGIY